MTPEDLLSQLENASSAEDFYDALDHIDECGYRFIRLRGSSFIDSLGLVDCNGRRYGHPSPLTLYHGTVGDDAYISYNTEGDKIGRCRLRSCSKYLKLIPQG